MQHRASWHVNLRPLCAAPVGQAVSRFDPVDRRQIASTISASISLDRFHPTYEQSSIHAWSSVKLETFSRKG